MQMAGRVGFVLGDQEVYLFGWSDAKKRMVGQAYFLDAESPDWEVLDMGETWATPWGDAWGDMPEPRSLAELQRVAETQVRLTRANAPEVAIGGRLIAAELSRAGITVRGVSDG
jgi:hypothetical protein